MSKRERECYGEYCYEESVSGRVDGRVRVGKWMGDSHLEDGLRRRPISCIKQLIDLFYTLKKTSSIFVSFVLSSQS